MKNPSIMTDVKELPEGRSMIVNAKGKPARIALAVRQSSASPTRLKVAFVTRATIDGAVRAAAVYETRLEMN